jgi:hypothetical protein
VAQQVHAVDRVSARGHPGDQATDLQVRVDAALAGDLDMAAGQAVQAGPLGQGHDRDQPGPRHEIGVVKRCVDLRRVV